MIGMTVIDSNETEVEILGARLQGDALAELIWSGALPAELESARIQIGRLIAGAAIRGAPAPKAEVDVAIAIDPGTSQVRRLHFRAYSDRPAAARGGAVGGVFVLQGGRIQAGGQIGAAADDDESDDIDFDVSAPLRYRDGLPQRSRKNKSVTDFVVTLRDHGSAIAPELDAAARQLLGR